MMLDLSLATTSACRRPLTCLPMVSGRELHSGVFWGFWVIFLLSKHLTRFNKRLKVNIYIITNSVSNLEAWHFTRKS